MSERSRLGCWLDSADQLPFGDYSRLPDTPAVYLVYRGESVLYVGKAVRLRSRWSQHHRKQQLTDLGATHLRWLSLERVDLDAAERLLISTLDPSLNRSVIPSEYRHLAFGLGLAHASDDEFIWLHAAASEVDFGCVCGATSCPRCGGGLSWGIAVPIAEEIVGGDGEYMASSACDACSEQCCEGTADADVVDRMIAAGARLEVKP